MPAYSTANDPIMQRYIALLNSNPALASQIDERADEIFKDMSNRELYDRSARRVQTPEGGGIKESYREYPIATALRRATEELAPIGRPVQTASVTATVPAPTLADIERGAANAEKMARKRETSMARTPKEPPSGMRDFRKQRLIDAGVGGLLRETATGMSDDQLLERMMMDQLEIGENAKKVSMQNAPYEEQGPPAPVLNLGKSTDYVEQGPPTFMQQGRDVDIIGGESSRSAGADEREPTGGQSVGLTDPRARTAKPVTQTTDTATEPTTDADQQSLLSRIGGLIANNPELTASGFQLLGGLLSNAAQNRAQRRADRTNRERTGRANLISALTGGRVRPDVERAQADTGGFMSLDTLGKALQGSGAAVKGELARRVAEDERERKAGLDERAASVAEQRAETQEQSRIDTDAYRDRLLTLQERGLRADYLKSLRSGQPKETPDKQTRNEYKAMSRILRQVDNVEDLLRDTDFFQAGSGLKLLQIAGLDEGLPQFMGGEKTRELKAAVNNLVQTLGEGLSGVLSDRDIEFLRQQAIKETDSLDTAMLKAQQIRNRLSQNIRENFEIDSQYFNMEPYRNLVDLVEASGEQGEGSFISDLSGASLNLD